MTNEELGRKWCQQNDTRPLERHLSGGYKPWLWEPWWRGSDNELPADVLEAVRKCELHHHETPGGYGSMLCYETESEAYYALGLAIRNAFSGTVVGESLGLNEKPVVTT